MQSRKPGIPENMIFAEALRLVRRYLKHGISYLAIVGVMRCQSDACTMACLGKAEGVPSEKLRLESFMIIARMSNTFVQHSQLTSPVKPGHYDQQCRLEFAIDRGRRRLPRASEPDKPHNPTPLPP